MKVVGGQTAGRQITLDEDFVVGRGESGMGNLGSDPEISRQHARFHALDTGEIVVEDLGSTNGTIVNGRRITGPHILAPGDQIRLGMTTLQLEGGAQPQVPQPAAVAPAAVAPLPNLAQGSLLGARTGSDSDRARPVLFAFAGVLLAAIGLGVGLLLNRGTDGSSSKAAAASSPASAGRGDPAGHPDVSNFSCVRDNNGTPGPGHFRFITSGCENAGSLVARFPLQRGTSQGRTVWYVVTDSSSRADALARHVNFAPKLANAAGTPSVQQVSMKNGVLDFPATVDFTPTRVLERGPKGFPPVKVSPPSVANAGYSPLVKLPSGIVINAPQIANSTGHADKALKLDTARGIVLYQETEGRYEDKHVHYASFESGSPVAATIEDVTYAPALNKVPKAGADELKTSAREELVAFVNGPTGITNPGRQGVNSTILDDADPHNILKEVPVLPQHSDIGDPKYAPAWDVHLAEWTAEATASGAREKLQSTDEVDLRVSMKQVTAPGGGKFGPSNFTVNCPLISIDVP